jgi:hypothetical protein
MRKLNRRDDEYAAELAAGLAAYAMGSPAENVRSPLRGDMATTAVRQLAMYLAHVAFSMSLTRVGSAFGRDRSTVAHACRQVEDARDDPLFDAWLETLESALREAPPPNSHPAGARL